MSWGNNFLNPLFIHLWNQNHHLPSGDVLQVKWTEVWKSSAWSQCYSLPHFSPVHWWWLCSMLDDSSQCSVDMDSVCSLSVLRGAVPSSKPTGPHFAEELPLGRSADSLLLKKLPAEHPWPSRLGHWLTTMNHFLCLMVFFIAFFRVGGSEPQPLIYKVIGDKNIAKKEKGLCWLCGVCFVGPEVTLHWLYMEMWGKHT